MVGEPPRLAPGQGDDPEVRVARVGRQVHVGLAVEHPLAVGRDLGIGQALELHHLGGGEGRGQDGSRPQGEDGGGEDGPEHGASVQRSQQDSGPVSRKSTRGA